MSKRPLINKRKRAQAFSDKLTDALGLDACTPLLTAKDAEKHGQLLPSHVVCFVMQRSGIIYMVPVARRVLFGPDYATDEPYLLNLVARVWAQYLDGVMSDIAEVLRVT